MTLNQGHSGIITPQRCPPSIPVPSVRPNSPPSHPGLLVPGVPPLCLACCKIGCIDVLP